MKHKLKETIDFLSNLKRSDYQGVEDSRFYWELVAAARYYTNFLDERRYASPTVTSIKVEMKHTEDGYIIFENISYSDGDWETYTLVRVYLEEHLYRLDWVNGVFKDYPEIAELMDRIPDMEDLWQLQRIETITRYEQE